MGDDVEEKGFTVRDRRSAGRQDEPVEQPTVEETEQAGDAGAPAAANLTSLVLWLAGMAHAALGEIPDPVTGQVEKNIEAARQIIDLLGVLEQKTRGNLTGDEERILGTIATELRIRYVHEIRPTT